MKEDVKGIWVAIILWILLMVMSISHFLEDGLIKSIGDYLTVFFMVIITVLNWLGIYSILKDKNIK